MHEVNAIAVIVDGYSTGQWYAPRLRERGIKSIHVQSQVDVPEFYSKSFNPQAYIANILFDDLEACVKEISQHVPKPAFVIAGSETGIVTADLIASQFGVNGNNPATSLRRRNKYHMGDALAKRGIPSARQFTATTPQDAVRLANDLNVAHVVVKPNNSAGSDDVIFCIDASEVYQASEHILGKLNALNSRNDDVLIQERLFGKQYIVNSISVDGKHYFTEVWEDRRLTISGASNIYDRELLLPINSEIAVNLKGYMNNVLSALDVKHGPCHSELILTENGPVLVEVSSRLQGSISPTAIEAATGQSHLSSHIESLINPKLFAFKNVELGATGSTLNLMSISLVSKHEGIIDRTEYRSKLAGLDSFYSFNGMPNVGDRIFKTVDLFTSPGTLYLISPSMEKLEDDYSLIREWEAAGLLFEIQPIIGSSIGR